MSNLFQLREMAINTILERLQYCQSSDEVQVLINDLYRLHKSVGFASE